MIAKKKQLEKYFIRLKKNKKYFNYKKKSHYTKDYHTLTLKKKKLKKLLEKTKCA